MAKKKRKEVEGFKEPEFDEVEFMKKEVDSAKAGAVMLLYSIPIAIVSFELTVLGIAVLGFFVGIIALFGIKFVLTKAGVKVKNFEKKDWAGNGALMFVSWFIIWMLLINPPFSDLAKPNIENVEVSTQNGTDWTAAALDPKDSVYYATVSLNSVVRIRTNITDNGELRRPMIYYTPPSSAQSSDYMTKSTGYMYMYEYQYTLNSTGTYLFRIWAGDRSDNERFTDIYVSVT